MGDVCPPYIQISIHAPRTGSDCLHSGRAPVLIYFNPRSPHGERRAYDKPFWGVCISIHAPRTGSDEERIDRPRHSAISIHAPRTGSDLLWCAPPWRGGDFNPRSPHGERPALLSRSSLKIAISIHAPRTGSDFGWSLSSSLRAGFQSTLPARGATRSGCRRRWRMQFQSTLPARGATWMVLWMLFTLQFQSTLPARGATCLL